LVNQPTPQPKKDDNVYVEQKNWTHVRHLLGYDQVWDLLHKYFLPAAKLEKKSRYGSECEDPAVQTANGARKVQHRDQRAGLKTPLS
jgi:hypothetical protein